MSKPSSRALADLSAGIILAQVEIAASPERVFKALTTSEVTDWWGHDEVYRTTGWEADLRVGGHWKATGMGADGNAFAVEGEYVAIDAPHRIVQTWRPDWDGGRQTQLTYALQPIEGGTRLTVRHEGFTPEQAQSCESHAQGWEMVLGWLHRWVAQPQEAAAVSEPARYLLRLLPPRSSFVADMTPQEQQAMGAHAGYWGQQMALGKVVLFGPVLDPAGVWGLLALEVRDEAEAHALKDADPVLVAVPGMRWEVMPFLQAVARPHAG